MNKRIYEIINEVNVVNTLKVIDMEEAQRLAMKLDSWNVFMFAEHEGETYVFSFDPTSASDIDEDVTNLHEEWTWMINRGEEE
jgi:hypothetical protein